MSDQTHHSTGGGNTALAFILGAVVVALIVIGYVVYTGEFPLGDKPDVSIELPGGTQIEGNVEPAGN
ncbi:MAG: hypothetical protein CML66_22295 [Rhodobacteraceae bacterium]|nr:hypothetical protein [Paracoccaceae bacterium]QEW20108.1 hypothetical protein LA6_002302 [Marinibacterium anthonyi]